MIPQKMIIPVKNATFNDWNQHSFWAHPWGKSGVHKGIDIFGKKGTPIIAPQRGIVIFRGNMGRGGKAVSMLGPHFRVHYFAHLESIKPGIKPFVSRGDTLGFMGNSGNAANTPTHLHYSVATPIPYIWNFKKNKPHAWQSMFFINPDKLLKKTSE